MSTAQDILKDLVGELKSLANTETVVGAPVTFGEFTVIPISKVALGVGAGGGTGEAGKKSCAGEGGGGGGGIRVTPVALVSVRGAELKIHMLGRGASFGHTVGKVPDLLESVLDRWEAREARKEQQKKEES